MASANNITKKKGSMGSGRKTLGLPARNPLLPASTSGPVARGYRGLQKSKSASFWEMHRMNTSRTPAQKDHKVLVAGRHQQASQAKSMNTSPPDQRGVGHSGSSRSLSLHGRTNQDQESSTSSGPPMPASVAATSNALAAHAPEQVPGGSGGHSGQHSWQPEEQSWVAVKKVRYFFCWGYS